MLVRLCLSVLLTVISLIVFIHTVTYELINDDDDDHALNFQSHVDPTLISFGHRWVQRGTKRNSTQFLYFMKYWSIF